MKTTQPLRFDTKDAANKWLAANGCRGWAHESIGYWIAVISLDGRMWAWASPETITLLPCW